MHPPADHPSIPAADLKVVPVERSDTIPSSWYVDPRFHALERDAVFGANWQLVGRLDQVERPGQFLVGTVADEPIIVVRGKDGALRAFFNVCRHRGGPLAFCDGQASALRCQYHGWTYLLDGSLRGVPQMDRSELFDKKDFGLTPVAVDTWEGLVFVHLGPKPAPVARTFAGILERIGPRALAGMQFARRVNYEVACNWKVYVDNYLEGYHVPFVHPELATLLDYAGYTTETFDRYSLQSSPMTGEGSPYDTAGGTATAYYYFVFPNVMLNILPGRLQTNVVQPLGPDRCRVVFDYFYQRAGSAALEAQVEADVAYSDKVQEEDREICEHVQRGLSSRAYDRGRFSPEMEAGVHHFQKLLKQAYAARMKPAPRRRRPTK
ncbi:MAG TPA: SRPBCC family protein [Gemmatimonadales bacterium]|nr:SRPBCC family protein [Gemmatimonadales bacterium]